jgi:hypothetical protein
LTHTISQDMNTSDSQTTAKGNNRSEGSVVSLWILLGGMILAGGFLVWRFLYG